MFNKLFRSPEAGESASGALERTGVSAAPADTQPADAGEETNHIPADANALASRMLEAAAVYQNHAEEAERLRGMFPGLKEEAAALEKELQALAQAQFSAQSAPKQYNGSMQDKQAELNTVQNKLRLLPGCLKSQEDAALKARHELDLATRELKSNLMNHTSARAEQVFNDLWNYLAKVTGGKLCKAKLEARAIMVFSDVSAWKRFWEGGNCLTDPFENASKTVEMMDRFFAGLPVRKAAPEE